jgi:predicted TIM-barrel fold metal-dependent hydrolase
MRQGFRFIDTDTHVGPNVETLEEHAGPVLRARWEELRPYYQAVTEGHHLSIDPIPFTRDLNAGTDADQTRAGGAGGEIPLRKAISLNYVEKPVAEVNNANWEGRLEDMEKEGVDVHLIFPATFSTAASVFDTELQTELYAAYHRYLYAYCASAPDRLKATILTSGADPEWSAAEIRRLAPEPWVSAVTLVLAEGTPADDPSLEPIWRAMDEADLPLVHHSFFYEPPYFPGYRDIWGNLAIARMAAHPWGAQRLLAYVMLSGLFDRFPNLRIGFSECSGGWVGGWLNRLEYQADYLRARLPEIKRTPIEYAQEGRVFCGIELDEGPAVARGVAEVVGEGVLMYSSDYPHGGCRFPTSVDIVLGWREALGDDHLRRIASENAERFLRLDA